VRQDVPVIRRLVRRAGHTRVLSRLAPLLVPADRLVGRLTGGRVVALGLVPSLILTTTGRRSGRPRSSPLLYVRDGDAFVVIGSNWGQARQPAWSLNLLADPRATVTLAGRRVPVLARPSTGAERERLWRLLVAEWPAYETYLERAGGRHIRIFRLAPPAPPGAPPATPGAAPAGAPGGPPVAG
jgi:deazaflavin-dependent oxidoreductase (nitroreductase family)